MSERAPVQPARRRALKRWGIGLGVFALLCGGVIAWGTRRPAVTLVNTACEGGSLVKHKALIVYATRAGSTLEVAQAIGKQLCDAGWDVDVQPVQNLASLDGYAAIVVGSAVRYGDWLPEMLKFMERNKAALQQRPLAYFTVCNKAKDQSPASMAEVKAYSNAARRIAEPKTETFFAGKLDLSTLSFFEGLVVKMIGTPVGDFRDWPAITSWAKSIMPALKTTT